MEKLSVVPATKQPTLQRVHTRFETWRKGKKPGSRIPKCLWKAAVELCDAHSTCEVSRTLGLNYTELKRRCTAAKPNAQISPTKFVEVPLPAPSSSCVVELSNASGATMKIAPGSVPTARKTAPPHQERSPYAYPPKGHYFSGSARPDAADHIPFTGGKWYTTKYMQLPEMLMEIPYLQRQNPPVPLTPFLQPGDK